jgi:hypothetical protein
MIREDKKNNGSPKIRKKEGFLGRRRKRERLK